MLGKLLKYDFRTLGKKIIPLFLGLIVLALFTKGFYLIAGDNVILSIPKGFITTIFVIGLIVIPLMTFIQGITIFYQNLIKDEGYLTHTLPVKKSSIVLSKCIAANVFLLISAIVSIVAFFIVFYSPSLWNTICDITNQIFKIYDSFTVIIMIVTSALGFLMQYFMFTLAIALGQLQNTKKGMYSVVYGLVLYTLTQIITSVFLLGYMVVDPNLMDKLTQQIPPVGALNMLLFISLIATILFCFLFYYATVYIFNKKLNLE